MNALAPRADEGRDKLRKAMGRSKYPDIRMRKLSWWKKTSYPYMSKVVYVKGTWGTETSKYPQEKKENSIP